MAIIDKKKVEETEEDLDEEEEDEDDDDDDDDDDDGEHELTAADVAADVARALVDAHESCASAVAERGKNVIIMDLDDGTQWRIIVKKVEE